MTVFPFYLLILIPVELKLFQFGFGRTKVKGLTCTQSLLKERVKTRNFVLSQVPPCIPHVTLASNLLSPQN